MSITIVGDPDNTTEQIKKNLINVDSVIQTIRSILEKDEFNFFNTRAKYETDKKTEMIDAKIQKLISLKMMGIKRGRQLKKKYDVLKNENQKLLKTIKKQIET